MKCFLKVVISLGLLAAPASSAEELSFQLGEFERSIPIDEFANYATGGSPGSTLRFLASAANKLPIAGIGLRGLSLSCPWDFVQLGSIPCN